MDLIRSLWLFVRGILGRWYYWTPPVLLDPFAIYDELIKPRLPPEWQANISLPSEWALCALIALLVWAAVLSFHAHRKIEGVTPDWRSDDAFFVGVCELKGISGLRSQ